VNILRGAPEGDFAPNKKFGQILPLPERFYGTTGNLVTHKYPTINPRLTKEKTKNGHDVTDHGNAAYAAVWYVPSGAKTGFSLF
jgi:hypothetical protein